MAARARVVTIVFIVDLVFGWVGFRGLKARCVFQTLPWVPYSKSLHAVQPRHEFKPS